MKYIYYQYFVLIFFSYVSIMSNNLWAELLNIYMFVNLSNDVSGEQLIQAQKSYIETLEQVIERKKILG